MKEESVGGLHSPEVDQVIEAITQRYINRFPQYTESINRALDCKDYETIRFISHEIKGSAGGFGLSEISAYAAPVEYAARAHDQVAVERAVGDFLKKLELYY